jgi:MYXO-CTERM domain-containing protein
LEPATVGAPFHAQLLVVGSVEPANVEITLVDGSELPAGLSLRQDGTLTGTAAAVGRFGFSVRATETVGNRVVTDTASFVLEVLPTAGFAITPTSLPDAVVGTAYRVVLEARLGRAPFAWTVDMRKLPRGLRPAVIVEGGAEKLEIAGTPEEVPTDVQIGDRTGGIATFKVTVTDAGGQLLDAAYALRVLPTPVAPPPPPEEGGCSCASTGPRMEIPLLLIGAAWLVLSRRRRTSL